MYCMFIPVSVQALQEASAKAGETGEKRALETPVKDKSAGELGRRYLI